MRVFILAALILLTAASGCIYIQAPGSTQTPIQTTPQPNTPPTIVAFTAVPTSINVGGTANLLWTVTGATSVSIDGGVGSVPLAGTISISPAATTTYTLTAANALGTSSNTATVVVGYQSTPTTPPPVTYPPSPPPTTAFAVTNVTTSVDLPNYSGPCPKYLTFTAVITSNGPGTATYGWERSDGALGLNKTITFAAAGSQTVSETWQLGESYSGWERVHVYNPNDMVSNQATFNLNCSFVVNSINATVTPITIGPCPRTVTFSATMSVNGGPVTVVYRWERSDGATGPTQSLYFGASSAQVIGDSWTLGTSYSGWERVHVLSPNDTYSNQASFALTCP